MPLSDLWEAHSPEALSDSDTDCDSGKNEEVQSLKRKLQTANARQAKAVKKAAEKSPKQDQHSGETSEDAYSKRLQKEYFTHEFHGRSYRKPAVDPTLFEKNDVRQQFVRDRARCVWSLLQRLKAVVVDLFLGRAQIQHVLNVCVADDTSTRLKPPSSSRSVVYTVMNSVQSAHFRFDNGEWECLHIPTPVTCLTSGKSASIHQAFTSWLVVSATGPGEMWSKLDCPNTLLDRCEWKTTILIGDALKANDGAWKCERKNRLKSKMAQCVGLRHKCCNHQLCLVRKPVVLSIERFWSTIVRLGHLMETHSFRRSMAAALVKFLQRDGNFVSVLTESWSHGIFG